MLKIENKFQCCGCSACVSVCPQKCIDFQADEEGFCYPRIDESKCINCGVCESVCPFVNPYESTVYMDALAVKNADEKIRMASSSGGAFYALAEKIISNGGAVAGVRWSDDFFSAKFDIAETLDDVRRFMTSKYLQAEMGDIYQRVKNILQTGRELLFCGTPCQIAGLQHFLDENYANLFVIEVICHGVPSPKVWRAYLSYLITKNGWKTIESVNFRDKKIGGQKCYHLHVNGNTEKSVSKVFTQKFSDNLYMKSFLQNSTLRPSCYNCLAKTRRSHADISIGDFWGIDSYYPDLADNSGVSCVVVNSPQGARLLDKCDSLVIKKVDYKHIFAGNPMLEKSVQIPAKRQKFWNLFIAGCQIEKVLRSTTQDSLFFIIRKYMVRTIVLSGLAPLAKKIIRMLQCQNA